MRSFHIITFGCQMNEHDSERMAGLLEGQGCLPTAAPEDADLVILNTCSIREKAEQKFYSELGRLSRLKARDGRGVRIAVAGCIAQQDGKKILSRAPYVDMLIGTSDLAKVKDLVSKKQEETGPVIETSGDPEYHRKFVPASRRDGLRAWVSIMYGCDNFCSYCVVPFLRGRERSRPAVDILDEVRRLASAGYKEVTLLGQNVNSYGRGTAEACTFPQLLHRVHDVEGIERIRFVTSHPRDLSEDLISAMRDLPKICEALHLPVQSGSDRILSAMNRKYARQEYLDKIEKLRKAVPEIVLTTDIIVGFPGEDEADYARTEELLREVRYDGIFAFKYSQRPNTRALALDGHLPERIKDDRLARVFSLQREITLRKNQDHVGSVQEVLADGSSKKGASLSGRTRGNKTVNFTGAAHVIGRLVNVRITSAGPNSLTGELCE